MRAIVCKEYGPPEKLVVEELPSPAPSGGQVVVEVHAAGVNFPDTLIIEGKYQFKPDFPFSPAAEYAGTVHAIGPDVTGFKVGDRVMSYAAHGAARRDRRGKPHRGTPRANPASDPRSEHRSAPAQCRRGGAPG